MNTKFEFLDRHMADPLFNSWHYHDGVPPKFRLTTNSLFVMAELAESKPLTNKQLQSLTGMTLATVADATRRFSHLNLVEVEILGKTKLFHLKGDFEILLDRLRVARMASDKDKYWKVDGDYQWLLAAATKALALIDEIYPPDLFDGSSGDEGPVRIVEIRDDLRKALSRLSTYHYKHKEMTHAL